MGRSCGGWLHSWTLTLIFVIGALVLLGGRGEAWSFEAELSEFDFLCFEVELNSDSKRLVLTFDNDFFVDVYDPDGTRIEVDHTLVDHLSQVTFVPTEKGIYTILIHSYYRPIKFKGKCNYDMVETSTRFKTTVKEAEWADYEIEVKDNNKPIALHLEYGGTYEVYLPVMFDPSGNEVKPIFKGSDNRSYRLYPTKRTGTYELSIEGNRILMPEGGEFKARCNYPISGPGIPMTIMGMTLVTITILIVLVLLAFVSLVAARWQLRRRKERAAQWRPVTDISTFEQPTSAMLPSQRDYSYLSMQARLGNHRSAPPGPPPLRKSAANYPPATLVSQPAPRHTAPMPPDRGMDGYNLPPPPSVVGPVATPLSPLGPVQQVHQTDQPPVNQQPHFPQALAPVQQVSPPQPEEPPPLIRPAQVIQPAPTSPPKPIPQFVFPKCTRCGNIILANHPVCIRCGSPR